MFDISNFKSGLHLLDDSTKSPLGSARTLTNMMISDRGGITKRPGTLLLGTYNSGSGTCGLYNFVQSFGQAEIPVKAYGTVTEYYHPDLLDWQRLESGFTSGAEWGWKEHLVNTENEDYLYFCNRTEDYRRWPGGVTQLNGALVGGETTVTVDATLKSTVLQSKTASSCTTTTIDVAGTPWAVDQWNSFYVLITDGANAGVVRQITDTDSNTITFASIGTLSGTPTFEIRMPKFPASGTLIIGTEEVAYSAIATSTTFTTSAIVSAHADNSAVTVKPTAYPENPKGNCLENYLTRMIVGNVRSGLARTSAGTLQGSQSTGSYYVSKLRNATDFTFSATRVAGEGDIVSTPYGGGDITDIIAQEKHFYVFKNNYIEAVEYTQDSNDFATRQPLKQGIGAQGKAVKGKDEVYFITNNAEITSIGRVETKDILPETKNIGVTVKRLLDDLNFDKHRGWETKDRVLFAHYTDEDSSNSRILVFNRNTQSFEGLWLLPAWGFMDYQGEPHYIDSVSPNVYKMFTGTNDIQGSDVFGFTSIWQSNWFNLMESKFYDQGVSGYGAEGYIKGDTEITFELYKDFATDASLSFTFSGGDSGVIDSSNFGSFLGLNPLGISIEGTLSDPDDQGFQHFMFTVYFPHIYGTNYSLGVANEGEDQAFEITRLSLDIEEDALQESTRVLTI